MIEIFEPFADAVLQLSACVGLTVIVGSLAWGFISLVKMLRNKKE